MQCDPSILWTLVEQDQEPGAECELLLRHVEHCAQCQVTLRSFAGDDTWWSDSQRWLTKDQWPVHERSGVKTALREVDLSFLKSATHPEMLGRIGRYDVEGFLGQGGMGVVLRGFDADLQRTVAIKVLAPRWSRDPAARERFAREAQAAASIAHENVVPIYHVHAQDDPPFLVMRYIPGVTLEQFVKQRGKLDPAMLLRIAAQLCDGLAAAHAQGLIHRDVKAGNVLVGDNVERIWLTDFGLARAADSTTLTHTGIITGTPHYMSPEQARGQRLDTRSDLFSLGAVFFYMSTGRTPFDADNTLAVLHQVVSAKTPHLNRLRPDLPPSFIAVVEQLLNKRRSSRPSSADEVRKRLRVASEELENPKMTRRRFYRKCTLAILLLVAGTSFGLTLLLRQRNVPSSLAPIYSVRGQVPSSPQAMEQPSSLPNVDPVFTRLAKRIDRDGSGSPEWVQQTKRIDERLQVLEAKVNFAEIIPLFDEFDKWDEVFAELQERLQD